MSQRLPKGTTVVAGFGEASHIELGGDVVVTESTRCSKLPLVVEPATFAERLRQAP